MTRRIRFRALLALHRVARWRPPEGIGLTVAIDPAVPSVTAYLTVHCDCGRTAVASLPISIFAGGAEIRALLSGVAVEGLRRAMAEVHSRDGASSHPAFDLSRIGRG